MCLPPTAERQPQQADPDPMHLLVFLTALEGRSHDEAEALIGVLEAAASSMDVAAEQAVARSAAAGIR